MPILQRIAAKKPLLATGPVMEEELGAWRNSNRRAGSLCRCRSSRVVRDQVSRNASISVFTDAQVGCKRSTRSRLSSQFKTYA